MPDALCLNKQYSTTRLLTQEIPEILNSPEDKFETLLFLPKGENRKGEGGLRTKGYFKKSYEDKPLISIITVVYNGEKYLEKTIQSVINQTYDNVEYIIIDGGSTDGTADIIKKYEDQIDYWVSEKDRGIYEAMNKGIVCATGKVIAFINADDWYEINAIEKIILPHLENLICDIIYGNIYFVFDENKKILWKGNRGNRLGVYIPHPATFYKTSILKKNLYNLDFKISADFELIQRLIKLGLRLCYCNVEVANFRDGGKSSQYWLTQKETFIISLKYIGLFYALLNFTLNSLRAIYKKMIGRR